jgi:hypothetical protein
MPAAAGFVFEREGTMAITTSEIRLIARTHARTAIATLIGVMRQKNAPPASRIAAANSLLDRAFGKPTQPLAGEADQPIEVEITGVVRNIVDPVRRDDDPRLVRNTAPALEAKPERVEP